MKKNFLLKFKLISDATFGRGDSVAGSVDQEVQHDEYGCPYLSGKTLRGVLAEECANILYALSLQGTRDEWLPAARRLFGNPGSRNQDQSILHVGDARIPESIREAVKTRTIEGKLNRVQVLESLTTVRYQTAVDAVTEAPKEHSLRSTRVILRQTPFEATIIFEENPETEDLALLAACIKAFRRAGTGRNRGRGELDADLCDAEGNSILQKNFDNFSSKIGRTK